MNKCSGFISLACAFGLLTAERVEAAPVTWDFVATSCSPHGLSASCDPIAKYPVTIAALTLTGPDSSGSARWAGAHEVPPVYTGDSFSFSFVSTLFEYRLISPAFPGDRNSECGSAGSICNFNLSWSEVAGQLTAVSISVDGLNDTLGPGFGLTGGEIASDFTYGGCTFGACEITGSWVNVSLVPRPMPGLDFFRGRRGGGRSGIMHH